MSTGAADDLSRVTDIARAMVTRWGVQKAQSRRLYSTCLMWRTVTRFSSSISRVANASTI
ncbi:MAG: hypothetical protein AAAC48_02020 [Phyllobacterium sp.]|uniref:hypothetical protein n=1 Tax=Phyllobacterium sp. TaxID=1871046 RepID=UPI0030F2A119